MFELGQGHCVSFPLFIIHKPDDNLTEEPFDKSYRVNAKTAEFDDQRDIGDCMFNVDKECWMKAPEHGTMKYITAKDDFDLSRKELKDRITTDFDSTPLPGLKDEGIIPLGFDDPKRGWPDFKDIFNPDWAHHFSFKDDELWTNADYNSLPPEYSM